MIRSMTGFARAEGATPQGLLLWEIRSVNHRFLEVQFRLPDSCRALEPELRQRATARLGRGRLEASLSLKPAGERTAAPGRLNLPLARQLIGHWQTLAAEISEPGTLNPTDILRWPGVLEQEEPDPEVLHGEALRLFDTALEELAAAREREGARLAGLFEARLGEIDDRVGQVLARLPEVTDRIRERLRERVAALGVTVDPERLEQELALIAQKMDVAEELDRLRAHIAEFRSGLGGDVPVGRRLDFLVQELNREANTLASKSADAETTRHAVDIKVLVEQIREQVQNVE
jgi:uncharacterized protein (TIGR00255 family)